MVTVVNADDPVSDGGRFGEFVVTRPASLEAREVAAKAKVEEPMTKPPEARETVVPLLFVNAGPPMERIEPSMLTADVPRGVNMLPAAASGLFSPMFAVLGGYVANGIVDEPTMSAEADDARE